MPGSRRSSARSPWQSSKLDEVPGINLTAAHAILAETGVDMTRFPTAGHLVSWARYAPGVSESAGKKKGNEHRRPRQHLLRPRVLGQRRRLRRPDRHLPGRMVLPADRPLPRREESQRRQSAEPSCGPTWHLLDLTPTRAFLTTSDRTSTTSRIDFDRRKRNHIRQLRSPRLHRHPRTRRLTSTAHTRSRRSARCRTPVTLLGSGRALLVPRPASAPESLPSGRHEEMKTWSGQPRRPLRRPWLATLGGDPWNVIGTTERADGCSTSLGSTSWGLRSR